MRRCAAILLVCLTLLLPATVLAQEEEPLPVPETDGPSSLSSEYWIGAPGDQLQYDILRQLTTFAWSLNKALLLVAESLQAFRQSLLNLFGGVLGVLGVALRPLALPLLGLGIMLALVLHLLQSFVSVSWASIRRGLLLALIVPLLFPAMGAVFTTIEGIRLDLATAVGTSVFDAAGDALGTPGPGRLADVAAWYLASDPSDLTRPGDELPARFTERFYTEPESDWSQYGEETRSAYLAQAWHGLRRMLFGAIPALLVVVDAALQALWTLALGLLFLGLTVALAFAVFGPFASAVYSLSTMIFNLILGASVISALQALLIAYLVSLTERGNAAHVFGMACFVLFLHLVFVLIVLGMAFKALFLSGGVAVPDAPEVAGSAMRRAGAVVTGGVAGGLAGAITAVNAVDPTSGRHRRFGATQHQPREEL